METTKDNKTTSEVTAETAPASNLEKDATVVTGQSGDQPVTVVMNPPKKRKIGIVVGIVVLLLFLIGGGSLAAWYFCIYNSPEVIAYDAMRQLLSAEHVTTSGTVNLASSKPDEDGNIISAELVFYTMAPNLPSSSQVTLDVSERDQDGKVVDNHQINLYLGVTTMSDGVVYLKVGDLVNTFNQALAAQDLTLEELDDTTRFAYSIVEMLDNEWWQISLQDIMGEFFDDTIIDPVDEFYNCILSAADEHTGVAEAYNQHRFVNITKTDQEAVTDGATRYLLSLDHTKLADFINALPETAGAEKAIVCYNDFADEFDFDTISTSDFSEIATEDLEKILPNDQAIYLEIANFNHRLERIETQSVIDGIDIDIDLSFEYSEVEVSAPADYRPISDLFDEIFELVGEYFYGLGDFEIDQNTGILMM